MRFVTVADLVFETGDKDSALALAVETINRLEKDLKEAEGFGRSIETLCKAMIEERDEARNVAKSFLQAIGQLEASDPEYLRVFDWLEKE